MGSITFLEHDGTQHVVAIELGKSLMQIATENGVPGIDADCGGVCACGTCHVILDTRSIAIAGSTSDAEFQMLAMTPEKSENSRLACQIKVSEALNGMVVRLPEFQM